MQKKLRFGTARLRQFRVQHFLFALSALLGISGTAVAQTVYTIGAGTTSSTATGVSPIGTGYEDGRVQYIYLASEITALGGSSGLISALAFNFTSVGGQAANNLNVKMGHTTATENESGALLPSPALTVYSAASRTPTTGWNSWAFSNNFTWNGTSNILVEVCFDNTSYSSTYGVQCTQFAAGSRKTFGWYDDSTSGCSMTTGNTATAANRRLRPNIRLTIAPVTTAPVCASGFTPANGATGVARNATLSWTAVSGAESYDVYAGTSASPALLGNVTTTSYTPANLLAANTQYYYRIVPKNSIGSASGCTTNSFTTGTSVVYCNPTYTNGPGIVDAVTNVALGTLSNASVGNTTSPYYTFYNNVTVPNIGQGNTATVSVTMGSDTTQYAAVWIDFNQNGNFEPSEGLISGNANANGTVNFNFTVPAGAVLGNTRMRVRGGDDVALTTAQACGASNSTYGETEDYIVNIVPNLPPTQCATLVSPANAATNVTNFTLSWTAPATGPVATSYDLYIGTTSNPGFFANVTNTSIVITGYASNTTYYWRVIPKSATGTDATGCTVRNFTTGNPFAPYCNAVSYSTAVEPITLVNFTGINRSSSATLNGTPALENYIADVANVTSANNYNLTLKGNTDGDFTSYFFVYFDWNHDGDFNDAGESYAAGSVTSSNGTDAVQAVTSIAVPESALAGNTRMRVKKIYSASVVTSSDACTGGAYGQSEDYTVNVTPCTPTLWYADADGDGYGNAAVSQSACLQPNGYVANSTDCDDTDNTKHQTFAFYVDADGDGYGVGAAVQVCAVDAATPPAGYALNNTDCNDADNTKHQTFEFYVDADNDGYGAGTLVAVCAVDAATPPTGYALNNSDCDDTDATKHESFMFYADADGDGYGVGDLVSVCAVDAATPPTGYALNNTDCDDNNSAVYQSATLYVDFDGDGYSSNVPAVVCYGATIPAGYVAAPTLLDCNDEVFAINPGHAEVLYNGVDDNCDGNLDEGFQITTKLLQSSCGATLASISSLIGIQTIAPGSAYTGWRIRATNGSQVQTIETNVPHFVMTQFPSYAYATTYTIEIELQRNGIWLGYYGQPCLVSTPAILEEGGAAAVSGAQCGQTLPKINTLIATTSIPGVTGYRFRVTNLTDASGPYAEQVVTRGVNWFTLQMLTRYNFGTTYRIEVAVKTNGDFGGYGAPCQVTSPSAPSLINCAATAASMSQNIAATSVQGATQYRFQITRSSDGASTSMDRGVNYFTFNQVPTNIFTAGAEYYVRVAVMTTGYWSPFGDSCTVIAPGGVAKGETAGEASAQDITFKATAYPNPFASAFAIELASAAQDNVSVKVYDMLGKLLDNQNVPAADLNVTKLGANYPAGVYNVVVTQGENVRTLRVIKR